ncbi:alpha/beta fold hydrolase [Microbacteriaceae bacterium VKM Ac-2854]|nr:alpha/beta fold hydrolase [Microbacteriaceae bacterium VKM Ac-2854]
MATTTLPTTVTSADGTAIAIETVGTGPALVLVDGAMCRRGFGPARKLAEALADRYTVSFYDRRGRDDSGDTAPYSVAREVEDLAAVLEVADGSAFVYGTSSGGALALEAAIAGVPMRRLAVYETPYIYEAGSADARVDHRAALQTLITAGDRAAAIRYFLVDMVGAPAFVPLMMRVIPGVWPKVVAVAHTLPNDAAVMGDFTVPGDRLGSISVPTLVLGGGKGKANMKRAVRAVAAAVPGASFRELPGQTHEVSAKAMAPALAEFFV